VGKLAKCWLKSTYIPLSCDNELPSSSEFTVFMQGSMKEHRLCVYSDILQYVEEAKRKGFSVHGQFTIKDWEVLPHRSKQRVMMDPGLRHPTNETLGEFWKSIFGSPHPNHAKGSLCSFFGVSKDHITAHPKNFYKKLISYVNTHSNPQESHYLKRLWPLIFSKI